MGDARVLDDYMMGLLMGNMVFAIINIVIIGIINSKATRIEKEVSFIHHRTQRSKRIEESKAQKIEEAEEKRKKHYAKGKKRP